MTRQNKKQWTTLIVGNCFLIAAQQNLHRCLKIAYLACITLEYQLAMLSCYVPLTREKPSTKTLLIADTQQVES